jgi:hypothetical protein
LELSAVGGLGGSAYGASTTTTAGPQELTLDGTTTMVEAVPVAIQVAPGRRVRATIDIAGQLVNYALDVSARPAVAVREGSRNAIPARFSRNRDIWLSIVSAVGGGAFVEGAIWLLKRLIKRYRKEDEPRGGSD